MQWCFGDKDDLAIWCFGDKDDDLVIWCFGDKDDLVQNSPSGTTCPLSVDRGSSPPTIGCKLSGGEVAFLDKYIYQFVQTYFVEKLQYQIKPWQEEAHPSAFPIPVHKNYDGLFWVVNIMCCRYPPHI